MNTKSGCLLHWDSATLESRDSWQWQVPAKVVAEFQDYLAQHPEVTPESFEWSSQCLLRMAAFGVKARKQLLRGDGVILLRGVGGIAESDDALRIFFIAFGSAMGQPMLQYGRLYPVVNRGKSYKEEAIPVSMTNAPTGFHTDSSARGVVPDFVGLLCEQPSPTGGDSLVSNAIAARDYLARMHPDSLALLEQDWIRDLVTPGAERTRENLLANRFPVFEPNQPEENVLFRYMRYWIEKGQDQAGAPASDEAIAAFDRLDEALAMDEHKVRFKLNRGDIVWVNNRALAHDRTGFEDVAGQERRLQRMWVQV